MSIGFNGTIQGTAPDNATLVGNPVAVAGVDNTGKVQSLLVASDGTLQVSSSGSGGGVVTQPDQTLLKDTSYQGGTWTVGLSAGAAAIGSVTVSNLPATQPISAASLPLPSGASTAAKQPSLGTAGSASTDVLTVQGIASMTAIKTDGSGVTQPVSGSVSVSNFPATQPVSGTVAASQSGTWTNTVTQPTGTNLHTVVDSGTVTANAGTGTFAISASSLPLPTGAATAANQTNVQGTAGSPSAAVMTVQGVASGTPQPVSGTVTANIGTSGSLALDSTFTNGTQKTQLVGATGNVAIVDANGNQQIKGSFVEVTSLTAGSLNADLVPSTDVSAYKMFSLQVTAAGVGILTLQGSNDNSTWVSVTGFLSTGFTSAATSTVSTAGLVYGSVNYRYMRVRLTTYTSGTFTGLIEYYTTPGVFQTIGAAVSAAQSGTWTVQQGSTPSSTPWAFNPVAATTGGYSFSHVATNTTTAAKSGAGYLRGFVINTKGVGTTATLYDSTTGSGTVIAVIDTTLSTTAFAYDIAFATGLTIVTAGTTPADITVTWK